MPEDGFAEPVPGEDGAPLKTEALPNGSRLHHMADGRIFEEDGPTFLLEYATGFPDATYTRYISIFGLAEREHLFEAWCYPFNVFRTYAFWKVVSLEEIATGQRITGEELRVLMGGVELERRP